MLRPVLLLAAALGASNALVAPSLSCSPLGLCFASGLSTGAVLQRAPERAVLYGSITGAPGAAVSLQLTSAAGYSATFNTTAAADLTWRVLLDPLPMGGNYSAHATCHGGCTGRTSRTISDLTFGDVIICSGQSNSWLPLWFTYERNTTLAAVLAGNYSNLRLWRGGLGKLAGPSSAGNWVAPEGLEPSNGNDDALTNQWRHPLDVARVQLRPGEPWLFEFPATCWYTAQHLTDLLVGTADEGVPMGIMTTPVGGTTLEEWTPPHAQHQCSNVTCMCMGARSCNPYQPLDANCTGNSALWWGNTQPFVNITLRHFLWWQGENSLQFDGGNSAQGTGYACLFPAMIAAWRAAWSAVPGTTSPLAPFGFVELADGTDEAWGLSMAGLRLAQTGSYGSVPNPLMPSVYRALGHDAGDQWDAQACATPNACCVPTWQALGADCLGDHRGQWDFWGTNWFQGQVHPRTKGVIGRRLAQGALVHVYGSTTALAGGPRFVGCTLRGSTLTLAFDAQALRGQGITWSPLAALANETTALYLLPAPLALPSNAGDNHHSGDWRAYKGPFANGNEAGVEGWVAVNAQVSGSATLSVDVGALGGAAPSAVRYAWGTGGFGAPHLTRMCTGTARDCSLQPCEVGSCPLQAGGLPGEPFLARIEGGKCVCLPPQVC